MTIPYQTSLHIFRRDLRLQDNRALLEALGNSAAVIPCFIFDPQQLDNNEYRSDHCLSFMLRSLAELDQALREKNSQLYYFYGEPHKVIEKLLSIIKFDAVYVNRDYTPYSIYRDKKIAAVCSKHTIPFHSYADALLHEPEEIVKADGKPYTVFTHAYKKAKQLPIAKPIKNSYLNYYNAPISHSISSPPIALPTFPDLMVKGGRTEGLKLLREALALSNYQVTRNLPAKRGTSLLSAHNKFGTVSIREIYHTIYSALGADHALLTELHWRDFFTHISFQFPRVFMGAFHEKYKNISFENNQSHFIAWCSGQTGFPIVDAGMRQLNATGYMHNRVRMIVASFLVKDLHIDWRWGEKYFAQHLVDYDPAINNGNWQWSASTGCDAQPYFRIFNPWHQQKKFDPDCIYIKQWVTELAATPIKIIHNWWKIAGIDDDDQYIYPIVNHALQISKTQRLYKNRR